MAKERPDLMDVDQVPRKEKKSSKDKVKKSKKAEKPKTETDSVDESSKVGLTSPEEQAPEMELAHRSNTGSSEQGDAHVDSLSSKEARKLRKKQKALEELALKKIMEQELGPSITESASHIEAEKAREKQKKSEKRAAKRAAERAAQEAAGGSSNDQSLPGGQDIFMVDVNPTPVDPKALQPPAEEAPVKKRKEPGYHVPPSGQNRAVRRRQMVIDRQHALILKDLGVEPGSNEKADEVKERLDKWTIEQDEKTAKRQAHAADRKFREATRLRNKKGKLPTGRDLKEREKLDTKRERRGGR